jgi:exodeoxyribonuclease V gamma subunit
VLYVHRSERSDHLVAILADLLAQPSDDPMVPEVVAVPTRGIERWLSQRLAHRLGAAPGRMDGICANVAFPYPAALVGAAAAAACGCDPDDDPWVPARMVWPLLEVIDRHLDEPWLRPLQLHLENAWPAADGGGVRRFATARHLADLYDHYCVHRPDLVLAWAAGDAIGPDALGPGDARGPDGGAAGATWQGQLWQHLRVAIGADSPAERLARAIERLTVEPGLVELPSRLALFGLTRLPASQLDVLQALAEARDVHLMLLHPSGALWDRLAERTAEVPAGLRRRDDPTADLVSNPLLRSWGRDAREMQLVLAARGATGGEHRPVRVGQHTLLDRIQADVRADRAPPGAPRHGEEEQRPRLDRSDKSLQVHACHGRLRQVEVMRDAILHLLAEDPTLELRDVVVMCPDIETFAPLVHAAFAADDREGAAQTGPGLGGSGTGGTGGQGVSPDSPAFPELRVRLADRALRQTNPLLAVADYLLELAGGRVTASQIVDLVAREPVRRRFDFDDDELAQIERWVADMGVRWGIDSQHRDRWGLGGVATNTWAAGLDRLLLGVAMADEEQRLFGSVLPVDDVAGTSVHLAGRLAELVERLGTALRGLDGRQPISAWCDAVLSGTDALALAAPADSWQRDQLRQVLDDVMAEVAAHDKVELDRSEVRSLLSQRLQGRPTRANFRTGDLTICTLVPMRSVPHRVVGLLGLDDGLFPRHPQRDGDDLLAEDPVVGDRDPRSEDRQLLLDALLAATEHLIVTYQGRDERTNHRRSPAVPIAELLDVVDRTVLPPQGDGPGRDAVLVEHPLQPFDPRNFSVPVDGDGRGPWSFDLVHLEGARALSGPRQPARPFLRAALPPVHGEVVALDALVRFVEHPTRAFLRERLGVYVRDQPDEIVDSLPIELDGLAKWAVGDRLLAARLAGAGAEQALAAELARGQLPPGPLGQRVVDDVGPAVEALVQVVSGVPSAAGPARSVDVHVRLPDGRRLIGTVPGVHGTTVLRAVYSRLAAKHRLAGWVRYLALCAALTDGDPLSVTVGRGRRVRGEQQVCFSVLHLDAASTEARRAAALDRLARLVDLYDRGRREPLPIYCATSASWAETYRSGHEADEPGAAEARADEEARKAWSESRFDGENAQPEHVLVQGGRASYYDIKRHQAGPDESGPGWDGEVSSRFARLALRLWDDLLAAEEWREQ